MSSAHAFLAPSSAARWRVCALSAALEAAYPDAEESPESLEGSAAHWVVQRCMEGFPPAVDSQAPNRVAVTLEMLHAAELVIETIEGALGPRWREMIVIERRVQIPRIHPVHCWGTPDYYAWAMLPDGRRMLFLFDFKYGYRVIDVQENEQLVSYVSGLMSEVPGIDDLNTVVSMVIIQPRAHHREGSVRRWMVCAADLRADVNILHMQAVKATGPNPPAVPDPDACRDCRGRHACEANQRGAYSAAQKGQESQAVDLNPQALGLELRALTRARGVLDARISGLTAQADSLVRSGTLVPWWMMEPTSGRLSWNKSDAEILALGQIAGVDLAKPPEPITPTQAKDRKLLSASVIKIYTSRPVGAAKLVPDDGTKARLTFASSNT